MRKTIKLTPRQVNAKRKHEGLPPLNFKLFRAVIKKLETTPTAYEQGHVVEKDNEAPCGTAACIGGWAYLLAGKRVTQRTSRKKVLNEAAVLLGLNNIPDCEAGDADVVFAGEPNYSWPEPFASEWSVTDNRKEQATIAVAYLRHLLATGDVNDAGGEL